MVWDGALLQDLLSQTPVIALLVIIMILDRRDHAKTLAAMRAENAQLQAAIIDHMNRLAE